MGDIDVLQIATALAVVLLAIAWYLSYAAARLDRLHAKVEGAMAAMDGQLIRRAETALELAMSDELDPSSALIVADAATSALERHTVSLTGADPLDGVTFAGREVVESDLTEAIVAAVTPEVRTAMAAADGPGWDALERLDAAVVRVQMARRFHNDAVRDVRRVRNKVVVRIFRLAGHAAMPAPVDFVDDVPGVTS